MTMPSITPTSRLRATCGGSSSPPPPAGPASSVYSCPSSTTTLRGRVAAEHAHHLGMARPRRSNRSIAFTASQREPSWPTGRCCCCAAGAAYADAAAASASLTVPRRPASDASGVTSWP